MIDFCETLRCILRCTTVRNTRLLFLYSEAKVSRVWLERVLHSLICVGCLDLARCVLGSNIWGAFLHSAGTVPNSKLAFS